MCHFVNKHEEYAGHNGKEQEKYLYQGSHGHQKEPGCGDKK